MHLSSISASLIVGTFALMGCSSPVSSESESEFPADRNVQETAEALNAAVPRDAFVGSFVSGARTLVLEADGSFTLDTGIRCITAPCPSFETGRWAVVRNARGYQVTLNPQRVERTVFTATREGAHLVNVRDAAEVYERAAAVMDACARVRCPGDTTCVATEASVTCVPVESTTGPAVEPAASCALTLCAVNTFCVEDAAGARCLPNH